MRETAYAKLNLALHVLGREPDGYHRLDTVFAFAAEGDGLAVEAGEELSLSVDGRFGSALEGEEDNLVLRAARALQDRFAVRQGAALILDKRLPVGAGIGGGSADAAAALRLLTRFWGIEAAREDLLAIAGRLGADVPACLGSRTCRGTGRGDVLSSFEAPELAGTPVLLVNPAVALSTATVFGRWTGPGSGPLGNDLTAAANDLEAPAIALVPEIGEVLEALRRLAGVRLARMSGSGATCFALFRGDEERHRAERTLEADRPDWWLLSTCLR
jgi:4-diphosphocytidyl-2-C-methyl-D-erythritol kinase